MSTKNLARTVIEGGRSNWNRKYRRKLNACDRAREHAAVAKLVRAVDVDDAAIPARHKRSRSFDDKLGPARRWLEHQAGRPWNRVRSELVQRFDTRTTAGRHIVFCHLLTWVDEGDRANTWRAELVVDAHGVLRRLPRDPRRWPAPPAPLPLPAAQLARWLADRRVGARGDILFWFTPTANGGYRQHQRLNDDDADLWRSLPSWFRERNHPSAPPALPPRKN